jgi:hypothetical protein
MCSLSLSLSLSTLLYRVVIEKLGEDTSIDSFELPL